MIQRISLLATVMAVMLMVTSCDKNDDEITRSQALVGNWVLMKASMDDGNQRLDDNEINNAWNFNQYRLTLTFKENKKGMVSSSTPVHYSIFGNRNFDWTLDDYKEIITIVNDRGEGLVTPLIYLDINHFAVLEQYSIANHSQNVWGFYERKLDK